ncbi:MAG: lipid biosynthesis B12-binding/radical SAM protein [Marinifilaceae bacterium]
MKILLISANRYKKPYPVYPIGLSYISTYLKKYIPGVDVKILDLNLCDNNTLALEILAYQADYIGLSLRNIDGSNSLDMSNFISSYKSIIDIVRQKSDKPVIVGGAGFSIYPESLMKTLSPDYGIIGEGEEAFRLLVTALENKEDTSKIEGLVSWDGDSIKCNKHKNYLKSLEVSFETDSLDYYWKESGMLNIQTKRGCCYDCIYCSYPIIDGRQIRTLDADKIVDDMLRLNKEKGINYLFFTDSVFNIKNDYNVELAEKIIRSGLKVKWGAYFSPSNFTAEELKIYKRSGLTHIEFGTESFCDEQLQNYGKNFTVEDVLRSSKLCLDTNVYYSHFLILGGYGETKKTLLETIENSKKIDYSVFFPFIGMRIYPKTRLYDIALREGKIQASDSLLDPTYYLSEDFDLEATKKLARATNKAWVFPDEPEDEMMKVLRIKKNKKGLIWEYLRKP